MHGVVDPGRVGGLHATVAGGRVCNLKTRVVGRLHATVADSRFCNAGTRVGDRGSRVIRKGRWSARDGGRLRDDHRCAWCCGREGARRRGRRIQQVRRQHGSEKVWTDDGLHDAAGASREAARSAQERTTVKAGAWLWVEPGHEDRGGVEHRHVGGCSWLGIEAE